MLCLPFSSNFSVSVLKFEGQEKIRQISQMSKAGTLFFRGMVAPSSLKEFVFCPSFKTVSRSWISQKMAKLAV